jgi:hypothetical protein
MKQRSQHNICKRSLTKIWKVSEKNNQTEIWGIKSSLNQIKNIVESHSSRLEQVEDRISGTEEQNRY